MNLQRDDTVYNSRTGRVGVVLSSGKAYTFVRWLVSGRRTRVQTAALKRVSGGNK